MSEGDRAASGATVAQLKRDIDSGETGQKVDFPDPGLSPLGTDDEAAGKPADPAVVAETRKRERAIGQQAEADTEAGSSERAWFIPGLLIVLLVVVVVGGFVLLR